MNTAKIEDYEEILATAQLYIDGCAKGDGDMMRPAFHELATINGAPIESLFKGATEAGPCDSSAHVDVLDVVDNTAVIRIYLRNYFGKDYVDIPTLLKTEDGWKVVSKVFAEVQ